MSIAGKPFDRPGRSVRPVLDAFGRAENGATATEYALIATIIGLMLVAVLGGISTSISGNYSYVSSSIDEAG